MLCFIVSSNSSETVWSSKSSLCTFASSFKLKLGPLAGHYTNWTWVPRRSERGSGKRIPQTPKLDQKSGLRNLEKQERETQHLKEITHSLAPSSPQGCPSLPSLMTNGLFCCTSQFSESYSCFFCSELNNNNRVMIWGGSITDFMKLLQDADAHTTARACVCVLSWERGECLNAERRADLYSQRKKGKKKHVFWGNTCLGRHVFAKTVSGQ